MQNVVPKLKLPVDKIEPEFLPDVFLVLLLIERVIRSRLVRYVFLFLAGFADVAGRQHFLTKIPVVDLDPQDSLVQHLQLTQRKPARQQFERGSVINCRLSISKACARIVL